MPRPRRKPKEVKPEAQPATVEKPVEVPVPTTPPAVSPTAEVKPEAQPTAPTPPPTPVAYTIKEATWEEFERFTPTPRKERPKSPLREAFEMAAFQGRVVRIEGLTPAQVRAVLALVAQWNNREGEKLVQTKYDVKAGVVYLAPAEKPSEKQ